MGADSDQAKPILDLLRKGQSRRQMKLEQGALKKRNQVAPRLYVQALPNEKGESEDEAPTAVAAKSKKGKKGKGYKPPVEPEASHAQAPRKAVMVSRDVLGVRPHFVAALLHVVPRTSEKEGDNTTKHDLPHFFFAEGAPDGANQADFEQAMESHIGLLEQNVGGEEAVDEKEASASAAVTALQRLRSFVSAQTRIHAAPELGNKRRAGALGVHNAEALTWPLRYQAKPHSEVTFSPLSIGWMKEKGVVSAASFASEAANGKISGAPKDVAAALQRPAAQLLSMPLCPYVMDASSKVMSVHPLSNGWETRNTADARGSILLECSSATSEAVCRKMLLALINEAIALVEEQGDAARLKQRGLRVLVEPIDVVCDWDPKCLRTEFPTYEELLSLPSLPEYCGKAATSNGAADDDSD